MSSKHSPFSILGSQSLFEEKMGNNKNVEKKEVDTIVEEAEKILRCCIFRLLEKVIDQECNTGQLDFSAIPRPILEELKSIKLYLKKCEAATDSMGDFLHHRILNVIDSQLEYTLKAHQQTFHKLTQSIDLSDEFNFAYESFVRIAKRFIGDKITWYRVVSLLCFGAEISVTIIKRGGPGVQSFINRIVHYVVEFLLKERVAEWIVHHGGWVSSIEL